jgi:hypothetical protein
MSIDHLTRALHGAADQDAVLDAVDEQAANALLAQAYTWEIAGNDVMLGASAQTLVMAAQMKVVAMSLRAAAKARMEAIDRRAAKGDR